MADDSFRSEDESPVDFLAQIEPGALLTFSLILTRTYTSQDSVKRSGMELLLAIGFHLNPRLCEALEA